MHAVDLARSRIRGLRYIELAQVRDVPALDQFEIQAIDASIHHYVARGPTGRLPARALHAAMQVGVELLDTGWPAAPRRSLSSNSPNSSMRVDGARLEAGMKAPRLTIRSAPNRCDVEGRWPCRPRCVEGSARGCSDARRRAAREIGQQLQSAVPGNVTHQIH